MKKTKFIAKYKLFEYLFDDDNIVKQATEIAQAILQARSLRLTDTAAEMLGSMDAAYKRIQRFLRKVDPRETLWRLFQESAKFVIGDVTEIERSKAKNTSYVGFLKNGKTRGFWVLVLATPFRGRAIPFKFITYSSSLRPVSAIVVSISFSSPSVICHTFIPVAIAYLPKYHASS